MKKRKLPLWAAALLPPLLLPSCLMEDDDKFDASASERQASHLAEVRQVLASSTNGWVLDYYPGYDMEYGGCAFTLQFSTDEQVVVRSELFGDPEPETSTYRLKADMGPVLSFDTYNLLAHFFATPEEQLYDAFQGDFEFVVDSVGADEIKLHGKRTHNAMSLRRLAKDPEEYIVGVMEVSELFNVVSADLTVGGQPVRARFNIATPTVTLVSATDSVAVPYTNTDTGLRLQRPVAVNGVSVFELAYDDDALSLTGPGVASTRCYINANVVTDAISNIRRNNDEFSETFELTHLEQFAFDKGDATWLTLNAEGNTLTVEASKNTEGHPRSAQVGVVYDGEVVAYFVVSQFGLEDILGTYTMSYTNGQGAAETRTAILSQRDSDGALNLRIGDGINVPVSYVEQSGAIVVRGGDTGNTVTLQNPPGTEYALVNFFVYGNGSYVTWEPSATLAATFVWSEATGTTAQFNGVVNNSAIDAWLFGVVPVGTPISWSTSRGYVLWLTNPVTMTRVSADQSHTTTPTQTEARVVRSVELD